MNNATAQPVDDLGPKRQDPTFALTKLTQTVRLARKGATFVVAIFDDQSIPERVEQTLFNLTGLRVISSQLADYEGDPFGYAAALTDDERHERLIVSAKGLDETDLIEGNVDAGRTNAAAMLDMRRDWLGQMPHVFMLWVNARTAALLRQTSPHFMSQVSGVFDLRGLYANPSANDHASTRPKSHLEMNERGFEQMNAADLRREYDALLTQLQEAHGPELRRRLNQRMSALRTQATKLGVNLPDPNKTSQLDVWRGKLARLWHMGQLILRTKNAGAAKRADAFLELGGFYWEQGAYQKAISSYTNALKLHRQIKDLRGEGADLGNLGLAYADLGDPRGAIEYYQQALKISREIGDKRGEGNRLGNLGLAYADLGDPRGAIEYYQQALKISREIGDKRGEGNHLGNLGLAYADLGDPRGAIEYYQQALKISREIGDKRGEGNRLGNLGNAYAALGDPRGAIEYYQQALKISREIGDKRGEGNHLGNLGLAYAALGDPRGAIEYYQQALKISREIGDKRGEGNHLGNLGLAYAALGDPRGAIEYYQQALKISREIGDKRGEGNRLGNLGNAYAALGDPRGAIEYYQQALKISREIGDKRGEGNHLGNLGNAYADLGDPRGAIEYYQQALKISREIGDKRGEGNHLGNLGLAYAALGDPQAARDFLNQAAAIFKATNAPHLLAKIETRLSELSN